MAHTANLLILVVAILDTSNEDGSLVGEDETAGSEVTVTGVEDGVQHGLVEKEVAHPLGDDDINLGEGKLDLLHLALDQGDLVREAVDLDDLAGLEDDGGHVNTDNVLGAGLGGKPARRENCQQAVLPILICSVWRMLGVPELHLRAA